MPITLSDAIRRVRSRLNEPAYPTAPGSTSGNPPARFFTDTEITDWLNDANRDMARRAEDLITYDTSVAIPAYGENPNQPPPTYPLPDDILRITRIEFQVAGDSSQIYPLEAQTQSGMDALWNIDQLNSSNYPSAWCTRGYPGGTGRNNFVIQLFPNPSQAGQLNIFYYRLPIRLTDPIANPAMYNTTLDIIEGWDDMAIDFAVMQAKLKKNDPTWQNEQKMYESKMTNVIDTSRRFNDQAQFMNYDNMLMPWGGGGDWGGGW